MPKFEVRVAMEVFTQYVTVQVDSVNKDEAEMFGWMHVELENGTTIGVEVKEISE